MAGGSATIGIDEEMNEQGWVRKKLRKASSKVFDHEKRESRSTEYIKEWDEGEVRKNLGFFRVNLSSLG